MVRIGWADVESVLSQSQTRDHEYEYEFDLDISRPEYREWIERDHTLLSLVRDTAERWEGDYPGSRERCVRELAIDSQTTAGTATATGKCIVMRSDLEHGHDGETGTSGFYHSISVLMRIPRISAARFETRWSAAMRRIAEDADGALTIEEGARKRPWAGDWRVTVRSSDPVVVSTRANSMPTAGHCLPQGRQSCC